ncbi:MAG: gliding motility lipoprotein GldH [Chitinophagales bacterium]|nr:gliding motility lipoprotein GldH [Chitinophagales bacterium]
MNDTLQFSFDIKDVKQPLNSYINIRHRFEFDWRNMWVKATLIYPNDSAYVFRINIPLSEPNGHWYGNCRGDVCMLQMPLTNNYAIQYTDTGSYTLLINHEMRENPLKGIMSVGFRLDNKLQNESK